MDTGPPSHSQHVVAHNTAGGITCLSGRDNSSGISPYDRKEGDTFNSTSYSNHGTQYGPYSLSMPFNMTGQSNWTTHPSAYYGRPRESYGYPGGPFWFPYLHQQYSFPTSMAHSLPYAPPPAHVQQRAYSFPYCAPQPSSPLAMVPVAPREHRLPPPLYTTSTPEQRYMYGSHLPTTSLSPSSDEIDLHRNSGQSEETWGNDNKSFYADVGIFSPRSSVKSDENLKSEKTPSDTGPGGQTLDVHLWDDPSRTIQNRQIFHQKSLNGKQDNNYPNMNVMEKRLKSARVQKNPEPTAGKACYTCAKLPWNKWASERPAGRRPKWSEMCHLSIGELDVNISCFIKDYPQLMPSVDPKQASGFIKNSLEEMENYLRKECHRSECQFLSDYPNENFPMTSNAIRNSFREMKFPRITEKTRREKREKRSDITCSHEADLWAKGILGMNNSTILLTTVHFYVSKCFGVRGQKKHQALRLDHFHFGEDPEGRYVRFHYETDNETDLGVAKGMISIKQYDDPENLRSFYKIIKIYVDAIADNKVTISEFYRRPNKLDNGEISFTLSALSGPAISGLIPRAMQEAGHEGYFNTFSFHRSVRNILKASGLPSEIQELRAGVRSPPLLARLLNRGPVSNDTEVLISRLLDPPKPNNYSSLISRIVDQQYCDNNDIKEEIPDTCYNGKLISQDTHEYSRPMSSRSCNIDSVDSSAVSVEESTTVGLVEKISDGGSPIEKIENVFNTLSTALAPPKFPKEAIVSSDEFDSSSDSLESMTQSQVPAMTISTYAQNEEEKSLNSLDDIDPSSFVDITLDSPVEPYLLVISEGDTITSTGEYPGGFTAVEGDASETLAASDTESSPLVNISGQSDPPLTSTPRTITPNATPLRPCTDALSVSPGLPMECYDSENDDHVPIVPTPLVERIQPAAHHHKPTQYSTGRSALTCPPFKKRKIDPISNQIDNNKENRYDM